MKPREVLDRTVTPDGAELELAIEHGRHILRVGGVPLMASGMCGSEEAMATVAFDELGPLDSPRILVGGLGMGFTLRAVLDTFDRSAHVCVAELMPIMIEYNRSFLAELAERPLEDSRVDVHSGDVRGPIRDGGWDVILLDVDNGPDALTSKDNKSLYDARGVARLSRALTIGGVLVVWSAYPSTRFLERLCRAGLNARSLTVRARWPERKGPKHTLFVARREA